MIRIGMDIDGVLYQWSKTARYMLREVLPNSPYTKDGPMGKESAYWNYIPEHVAPEHWKWLWTEGVRLGMFRHGHIYPGAIQAMRRLAEIGDVIIITHRPKAAVQDTLAWLVYQDFTLAGVHLLTNMEPKSTVRPKCDIYLDDKPENIEDLLTICPQVYMMDRPWNQAATHLDRSRVRGWPEFINMAEALEEMS